MILPRQPASKVREDARNLLEARFALSLGKVMRIPIDRRAQPRLRLRLPVRLSSADGERLSPAEVTDISADGACLLVAGRRPRVGQTHRVRFEVDGRDQASLPPLASGERKVSIVRVQELADGRRQVVVRFH